MSNIANGSSDAAKAWNNIANGSSEVAKTLSNIANGSSEAAKALSNLSAGSSEAAKTLVTFLRPCFFLHSIRLRVIYPRIFYILVNYFRYVINMAALVYDFKIYDLS